MADGQTGAKTFYLPSADYIWPHVLNKKVREVVTANGGEIVGEEYFPLDHADYRETVERDHGERHRGRVQHDRAARPDAVPGAAPRRRFHARGGQLVCTYFDENFLNLVPAAHVEGLYSCLDYYQAIDDPFSRTLLAHYNARNPGARQFTGGSACSGLYRGIKLWEAAVLEAGTLRQDEVIAALDHASIAEGPGGTAEMVPGQHHVRMRTVPADRPVRGHRHRLGVVENLGQIDPKECEVG